VAHSLLSPSASFSTYLVSAGLTRSAFSYTAPVGTTVRLLACGVLLLVELVLLVGVVLSFITSLKAVWLDGSKSKWGLIGTTWVPLSDVAAVSFKL
jgi:hypothetical protein